MFKQNKLDDAGIKELSIWQLAKLKLKQIDHFYHCDWLNKFNKFQKNFHVYKSMQFLEFEADLSG